MQGQVPSSVFPLYTIVFCLIDFNSRLHLKVNAALLCMGAWVTSCLLFREKKVCI